MSSDYRPRGGSSSSNNSNRSTGGGESRRRRGGRGRGPRSGGEHRSHPNGTSSNGAAYNTPKKKTNPITAFFGWIFGKKTPARPASRSVAPETRENRPPREHDRERGPRPDRAERGPRPERTERGDHPERPARAERAEPVPQEIVSPKLYVGNLAYEAAESDLFDLFSKVGAVKNVEIAMDRNSGRSKGFGFVEMEVIETAKEAAEKLNRTDFMGRQIVVSGAKVDKRASNPREEAIENEGGGASSEESGI